MMTFEQRFRRNLIAVAIGHGVFILGLVIFDWVMPAVQKSFAHEVELVVPADHLGDLPKGPGVGRGAYAPAPPPAPGGGGLRATLAPAAPTAAPAVRVSRTPTAPVAKLQAGEVAAPKKLTRATKTTAQTTAPTSTTASKSRTSQSSGRKTGAATGTGTASATAIRNRFANALGAQPGGTPYGDGRPGGGGSGRSSVIGSPDGSPDGVVGGVGKGTPFWWYYEHVHDRLYEAWDQPGDAVNWNKNLVSTLVLTVARDGRIVDVDLKVTSGNRVMDESALTAARSVPRLQPLPEGLGDATAKITVNFRLEG